MLLVKTNGGEINGSEVEEFCTRFSNRGEPIFDILNEEYIEALGNYLNRRIDQLGGTERNQIVILETGAGSGKLSHFLKERLQRKAAGKFNFISVDLGTKVKQYFPIKQIDYREALKKFQPSIVITSWMPQEDWTRDYRKTASVQEYILIGNPENTGTYSTWGMGIIDLGDNQSDYIREENPEYKREGFEDVLLKEVSQYQISRAHDWQGEHSQTIVFRRRK